MVFLHLMSGLFSVPLSRNINNRVWFKKRKFIYMTNRETWEMRCSSVSWDDGISYSIGYTLYKHKHWYLCSPHVTYPAVGAHFPQVVALASAWWPFSASYWLVSSPAYYNSLWAWEWALYLDVVHLSVLPTGGLTSTKEIMAEVRYEHWLSPEPGERWSVLCPNVVCVSAIYRLLVARVVFIVMCKPKGMCCNSEMGWRQE